MICIPSYLLQFDLELVDSLPDIQQRKMEALHLLKAALALVMRLMESLKLLQ